MPSPIAHASVGYALYRVAGRTRPGENSTRAWWPTLAIITILSMLPDLDAIWGLLLRDLGEQHNQISHSLGLGAVASVMVGGVARAAKGLLFRRWFLLTFIAYALHLLLDYWSTRRGIMLFWPFSSRRFASPIKLFYGVRWKLPPWNVRHLWTLFTELLFAVLVVSLTRLFVRR